MKMKMPHTARCHNLFVLVITLLVAMRGVQAVASYLGPEALAASRDGKTLYIALADARQLAVFDVAREKSRRHIPLPAEPTGLALSPDGGRLYVTCAAPKSTVAVIDTAAGRIVDTLPAGHTAHGLAVTPDGKRLYVCNRFDNDVSVIDVGRPQADRALPVTREPYAAVATPDGKTVFVVNQLPLDRADGNDVAANVSAIDTASNRVTAIRLPNGSSSVRGMCLSPDGRYVYVVHVLSHYQLPATQLDRGWINTGAMSIIDAAARQMFATVLLDDIDQGAALPWGVAISGDGRTIFVSHAGTHELSRIDAAALLDRLTRLNPAHARRRSTIWRSWRWCGNACGCPATVREAWPWRASGSMWQSISAIRWPWWISIRQSRSPPRRLPWVPRRS